MDIRTATVEDIETLVRFRVEMFREMGGLTGGSAEQHLTIALREYFSTMIPAKRFCAWIAVDNGKVVGSSGLIFLSKPPSPDNMAGIEGYIMNMYTPPAYRGQGIATALLKECIRFARSCGAGRVSLHASDSGRPVYEEFGFIDSPREMRMVLR